MIYPGPLPGGGVPGNSKNKGQKGQKTEDIWVRPKWFQPPTHPPTAPRGRVADLEKKPDQRRAKSAVPFFLTIRPRIFSEIFDENVGLIYFAQFDPGLAPLVFAPHLHFVFETKDPFGNTFEQPCGEDDTDPERYRWGDCVRPPPPPLGGRQLQRFCVKLRTF